MTWADKDRLKDPPRMLLNMDIFCEQKVKGVFIGRSRRMSEPSGDRESTSVGGRTWVSWLVLLLARYCLRFSCV